MTTLLSFRGTLRKLVPPWLSDVGTNLLPARGFKFLWSHAVLLDAGIQDNVEGLRARMPGVGTPTALPYIGRDRVIRRGRDESDASFAARQLRWREDHKTRGSAWAVMAQVKAYLTPHKPLMRIVTNNGTWKTLNPDDTREIVVTRPTPNWDWDGDDTKISRAWLIIYPPPALWTQGPAWGDPDLWDGAWGSEGFTWGSTATPAEVDSVRAIVKEWKAAHTLYQNIIIAFDEADFDPTGAPGAPLPDGTWGHWSKTVAGVQVPARLLNACYWDGVS